MLVEMLAERVMCDGWGEMEGCVAIASRPAPMLQPSDLLLRFSKQRDGKILAGTVPKWSKIIRQNKWVEFCDFSRSGNSLPRSLLRNQSLGGRL